MPQCLNEWANHGYWMCAYNTHHNLVKANKLAIYLKSKGIDTRPSFIPMTALPPYFEYCNYPGSARVVESTIVLPSYPTLTNEELEYICHTINDSPVHLDI